MGTPDLPILKSNRLFELLTLLTSPTTSAILKTRFFSQLTFCISDLEPTQQNHY